MSGLAHLTVEQIDVLIETDEALIAMEMRAGKDWSPVAVAAHNRIELAWAEKRARKGSGFGKPPEDRR